MNLDDTLLFLISITAFCALLVIGCAIEAVVMWFIDRNARRRAANSLLGAWPAHLTYAQWRKARGK